MADIHTLPLGRYPKEASMGRTRLAIRFLSDLRIAARRMCLLLPSERIRVFVYLMMRSQGLAGDNERETDCF